MDGYIATTFQTLAWHAIFQSMCQFVDIISISIVIPNALPSAVSAYVKVNSLTAQVTQTAV